jgi:hypothetical protein
MNRRLTTSEVVYTVFSLSCGAGILLVKMLACAADSFVVWYRTKPSRRPAVSVKDTP